MRYFFSVVLTAGVVLFSCTYEPEDTFVNPIDPPDLNNYSVVLNTYDDQDTIEVYGPMEFNYDVDYRDAKIESSQIFLDNKLAVTYNSSNGRFNLERSSLRTGFLEMKILFITNSGTGSLLDKLGGEKIQVWRTWILKVDVDPPPVPAITVAESNGYAVVKWTGYTRKNFDSYRLIADYYYGETKRELVFRDQNITSWVDSSYAGTYNVTYSLTLANKSAVSYNTISKQGSVVFNASFNRADSIVTVNLTPPVYYNAFKYYRIAEDDVERLIITDKNQAVATFKLSNESYTVSPTITVQLYPKNSRHPVAYGTQDLTGLADYKKLTREIDKFHYNKELNTIIGFWSNSTTAKLFKIDPETFHISDSLSVANGPGFNYKVPYEGIYAYYSNQKKLIQINLITHEEKDVANLVTSYRGPNLITASHNQLVSYGWFGPGSPTTQHGSVYNISAGTTLFNYQSPNIAYDYELSDDGKFLKSGRKVYRITASANELIGSLYASGKLEFRQDKCDEILAPTQYTNVINVYDASTLTLKRQVNAASPSTFVCYDVMKGKMIFRKLYVPGIYAVDIETNKMQTVNLDVSNFVVVNGNLFTNKREYIKIY